MKEIGLTRGYVAFVDDDDYDCISSHKWHVYRICTGNKEYVYPRTTLSKTHSDGYKWKREVLMHRFIMSAAPDQIVDHVNGNTLDCRRDNLRICTSAENSWNAHKSKLINGKPTISEYKGLRFDPRNKTNPWTAHISVNKKRIYLGKFKTEEEAALMYDVGSFIYHGKFGKPNFCKIVA